MYPNILRRIFPVLAVLAAILFASPARAVFHLWQVSELYSNASGSVQYIQLDALAGGQQFLAGHAISASQGGTLHSFTFPTDLPGDTSGRKFLVGTQGFANLGIVTPDYVVPDGFLPLPNGNVNFAGVDSVTYSALPTDGVHGLDRNGNSVVNAPTNFAGISGSIQAAKPAIEGSVVEYINTADFPLAPGGHFFYSTDAAEQQFVDSGQAGHFERTGRSFNAGGNVPVCRFYGSQTPGPNSHFFSADQNECAGLKAIQKFPTPTDVQQWNSEGDGFKTTAVVTAVDGSHSCQTGTVPVYRAYNNAFANGIRNAWDSNHRFSTSRADIDQLVTKQGWADEGLVFCAPS